TWRLVEVDARAVPDGEAESPRLNLNGPVYKERTDAKCEIRGACWTDPLAEPPAISFTPKTGADGGRPRPGIYRLDGTTLTVCLAPPGHPRPTALVALPEV